MRIALVTTPPDPTTAVGRVVRGILPHLQRSAEVSVYAPGAWTGDAWPEVDPRPIEDIRPRDYDQVLYPVADEPRRARLLPLVRGLGGTVALFDWCLADLARAAWPELASRGPRGFLRAVREGGLGEALVWRRGPDRADGPALNRSVVRFADAFLVPSEELKQRVLASRNAPTPIGVLAWDPPAGSASHSSGHDHHWRTVAEAALAFMERFPHARASRRSLIALAVRERWDSARAERPPGG